MADQLEEIAKIFILFQDKSEILTHCFLLFTGWKVIKWRFWLSGNDNYFFFKKDRRKIFCITGDVFTGLVNKIKWITEGFWITSYVPPIEGFITPHILLYSCTVEQFITADNFYNLFIKNSEPKYLNNMLACLYTDSFKNLDLDFAATRMGRREYYRRFAAFLWFSGVKTWLRDKYPFIFTGSNDTGITEHDATVMNLLSALNGGDITKNDNILKSSMHMAFYELNQKVELSKDKKHV